MTLAHRLSSAAELEGGLNSTSDVLESSRAFARQFIEFLAVPEHSVEVLLREFLAQVPREPALLMAQLICEFRRMPAIAIRAEVAGVCAGD